jgi:hypothetical protein
MHVHFGVEHPLQGRFHQQGHQLVPLAGAVVEQLERIPQQGWGVLWCWLVITTWICALGLIYWGRYRQGRWRRMRVIEPDLSEAGSAGRPAWPP